jgi:predicted peptidase
MASPFASSDRLVLHPTGSLLGAPLGLIEYQPPGYGEGAARPLLLYFHGSSESGDGSAEELPRLLRNGLPWVIQRDAWPAERPFVVLMAQHDAIPGSPCTEATEIEALLDWALESYEVDPAHVYLTGVSCGAIGAWNYLGMHADDIVAAAVLIAGDGNAAVARGGCDVGRVAIWAFHGERDTQVDQQGSIGPIEALTECTDPAPVDARLTVFPGVGHAIWNPIYEVALGAENDIYPWMLTYENPPAD